MKIEWEQDISAAIDAPLALVAMCCQAAERVSIPLGVHILLTGDERIHQLNRDYRSVDRATDVLSFPAVRYRAGRTAHNSGSRIRAEYDPDIEACMLGDIVISYPHAVAQGESYGHGTRRELCYLLAHGLFHLMGYDHIEPDQQKEMRAMEEKALRMAGVARDPDDVTAPTDEELCQLARLAMENSYSPYSRYAVGAALVSASGRVYLGCNIENASFGISNCAERTALFKAVSEGERAFTVIAIASNGSAPYPCGACRQALNEFAPDLRVLVTWGGDKVDKTTLPALLPHGFGPKDVQG